MAEKTQIVEASESSFSEEMCNEVTQEYLRLSAEMEAAGNHNMAEYYAQRAKEFATEATSASDDVKLGGWYAGYTPAEWRRMASNEYAKNGNSVAYRRYISNAQKAEG